MLAQKEWSQKYWARKKASKARWDAYYDTIKSFIEESKHLGYVTESCLFGDGSWLVDLRDAHTLKPVARIKGLSSRSSKPVSFHAINKSLVSNDEHKLIKKLSSELD